MPGFYGLHRIPQTFPQHFRESLSSLPHPTTSLSSRRSYTTLKAGPWIQPPLDSTKLRPQKATGNLGSNAATNCSSVAQDRFSENKTSSAGILERIGVCISLASPCLVKSIPSRQTEGSQISRLTPTGPFMALSRELWTELPYLLHAQISHTNPWALSSVLSSYFHLWICCSLSSGKKGDKVRHLHLKASHFGFCCILDAQAISVTHTDKFSSLIHTYLHMPPCSQKKLSELLEIK